MRGCSPAGYLSAICFVLGLCLGQCGARPRVETTRLLPDSVRIQAMPKVPGSPWLVSWGTEPEGWPAHRFACWTYDPDTRQLIIERYRTDPIPFLPSTGYGEGSDCVLINTGNLPSDSPTIVQMRDHGGWLVEVGRIPPIASETP